MFSITKPRVPEGLRDLMKDLTREILKEKPTDIYNFAENYFLSRLPEKEHYKVKKFEDNSGKYDFSYIKNSQRYQIPIALVNSIIPESLTNLIKDLVKAILREQPENLCDFAVEYFRHLKATVKSVNPSENIAKEINYSAYENYFNNKERFLLTPYVKCKCGRILGESEDSNYNVIQNGDKKDKNKDFIFTEKYLNSVILIQRYIRRYLNTRNEKTNTNERLKDSAITEQINQTSNQSKIIIPKLHLHQVETENVSEDASYTSASTALLSASESGRDNSDLSTTESVPTKTIIENEEIENNEKNFPTYLKRLDSVGTIHQSRSNEETDDDSKSTLNDKKLNSGEGDVHKLTCIQSEKPRSLNIIRAIKQEKSIEDNKKEPSEIEHYLSNKDINESAGNSSVTDGNGSFFDDHNEINSDLFEAIPVVDTKIYSNEEISNQNENINSSLQTKEKHLESMKKVNIAENMNAGSENIRRTSDIQQQNSSIETNVVLSGSEAVTNNSDKNCNIELENKIFANEKVNDNVSLEKNLQNLSSKIPRDHITNSEVSTEEQKLLKINKYSNRNDNIHISKEHNKSLKDRDCGIEDVSKAENIDETKFLNNSGINNSNLNDNVASQKVKNAECINNDFNDVHVEGGYSGLSTEEDVNADEPQKKADPVNEHNDFDGNRKSVQHVLTLPVNEQNIQTTDVTTDKIPCDESKNIVDFNLNHERSENIDTNKESEILGENQINLSTLHESNNSFNEQDTTLQIINDEVDKTNNDNTREKYSNMPHKVDNSTYSKKLKVLEDLETKENTENVFAKPKTELYETDVIDKPEADMTVERTLGENEMENVIVVDQKDRKLEDTFDEQTHKPSLDLNKYKKFDSGVYILQKDFGEPEENKTKKDVVPNESHRQHSFETNKKSNETNSNQDSIDDEKYKITTALKSPKDNIIIDMEKGHLFESTEFESKQETNKITTKSNDKSVLITKNNMEIMNESHQHESPYISFDEPRSTDNLMIKKIEGETENDKFFKIGEKKPDNKSKQKQETLNQNNNDIKENNEKVHSEKTKEQSLPDSLKTEIYSNKTHENYKCQDDNAVDDTDATDILNKKENQSDANKSQQNLEQNIVMENGGGASEINKEDLKESVNEMINYENIRNDTTDNMKSEINSNETFEVRNLTNLESTENYVMNNTIPYDIVATEQISDEIKLDDNRDMEKGGMTTEMINSENTKSDVTDVQTSTSQTGPSNENNPEQRIHQNEKESQSDENKSSQNQDIEKDGTTTEKINSEHTRSGAAENLKRGQKFKLTVVDSVGNDTISDNIITDDQTSMTSQTNSSEENKPEQSINQNIDMEERTSNENKNQSDENKSIHNYDMEKEGITTKIINSENTRSDITDNLEIGQKFQLNVVDSVGNDTISGNIIPDAQSNATLQANPSKGNKPEQTIDQNNDLKERKSNENGSQSDENKSSQNQDIEKEGTITEKINSENIRSDINDNSETGQKFQLNVVDSMRNNILNNTISNNIAAGDQASTSPTNSSDENKSEHCIDKNEKESQCYENKSSQNLGTEKEGTASENINSENTGNDATENSETGQKVQLNVVDSVGNDTISGNIIPDDESNTTLQTRPIAENKPGLIVDQNIDMKERKSNENGSQNDENKSSQNYDMQKEGSSIENINSENIRSDINENSGAGQKLQLNVVDSMRNNILNDTISNNIAADDQTSTSPKNSSDENKSEHNIDQNEKESQCYENKSSQNLGIEKEGTTTEKINSENTGNDARNVVDSVGNDTISGNIIPDDESNTTLQTRPIAENKPGLIKDQNIDMKERKSNEKGSQSDENKSSLNQDIEKEGAITEKINSENTRSDINDNSETGQKVPLNVVDSVGNDTISGNIIPDDESNTTLQINPSKENKPEQTIDQNIDLKERKSNENGSQNDENKSSQNYDMQKEGSSIENINSENIRSDINENSEAGQKLQLNVDDSMRNNILNDTISNNIAADDQTSTSPTNSSDENKSEHCIDKNEKESQCYENKSNQNLGTEKEGTASEKINSENTGNDATDNSETGRKVQLNVVDSVENDTISGNIIPDDESNTTLQTNPSKGNKLGQTIDQNNDLKERKSNEKGSQSDENNSSQNLGTEKEGTASEKINFENASSDATDNLNTGQQFKLNVVDSVGNDTISGNIIPDGESNTKKENKPEQNIDRNIDLEKRKSNEKESKSYENKSSENLDTEKEGTTTEKINSENTGNDATDNSETGQKVPLNVVDSVGNDTISGNIIPDDESNTTLQTRPIAENKPGLIVDQNIDMKERKSNEKGSQSDEKKSSLNQDIEKEGAITEKINSENIRSDINDNSEIGQKFQLNVADSVGNDTISGNIIPNDQSNATLQTNPSKGNKPEQTIDQNIDLKERKSNESGSQSDENKSSQNLGTEKERTASEKINSENTGNDATENSETGQKVQLNVVDSVGNDTISGNIIPDAQSNATLQANPSKGNKPEQTIDQNNDLKERKSNESGSQSDENKSSQNLGTEKEGTASEKINSENTRSDDTDNLNTGQKFQLSVVDSVGNDTISDNIIADDQTSMTSQTNLSVVNEPEQSIDENIDMERAKKIKKKNDPNDVENENIPLENTTILNNISANGHMTPIAPNVDISQQNERSLNNNIVTNEESIIRIHRNDSKELEIKKTIPEDTRPEFIDNANFERKCDDNLLKENFDKNVNINETFTTGTNDEKIHFEDFKGETTDNLNLKIASDITNNENTVESVENIALQNTISNKTILEKNMTVEHINEALDKKNKKEVGKTKEQQEEIDQSIEMKRERRETTPINRADSNESINDKIKANSENDCIDTTGNLKAEICCKGMKKFHDESDVNCTENDNLNKTVSDINIADNHVNTTIHKCNREDPNDENIELKQNLVQRIDIEDKKKTEMIQDGTKITINEGIHLEDTTIKETDNSDIENNSDENLKHHDKNAFESIENDILNKTILGKSLTGNKQKLEQNEENLDRNKLKTEKSTDSTQQIHHGNVSVSDNITKGEQINAMSYEEKGDANQTNQPVTVCKNEFSIPNNYSITHSSNSAHIKLNETIDDTGKNCEKSPELNEHNNLNRTILIEHSNVEQGSLTTDESESFEIKHRFGGISDQTNSEENESKLNEINCDNAKCENGNVKSNTEEPTANETDNIADSTVKCGDEQKVSEAEITSNHGNLKSSTPTENPSIFCRNSNIMDRDLIPDLKEQPSSILTNTENGTENEFDKKKSISDETNIELRQLGVITSSDNKDGVMASASNKTDEGSENISTLHENTSSTCNSNNKYIESDDSKENNSYVSTKDNGVSEFEDLSALITSNKIEKECKINNDGSITKIASEANENTATTQQKQELSPKESINLSNHNGSDNPNSTNFTMAMENLKTSTIPTNLIMRDDDFAEKYLSAARHVENFKLDDVNQQISIEKINEINHLETETNNSSTNNIENNFSHNESVNSQDNKLKHTEINNNEGKPNENLNMMRSHKSSQLNVTDTKNDDEDITKIETIKETRFVSDVEGGIEIKSQRQQEIVSHQENHEASSNTLTDDADGKGDTSDQATTLSIGNKTPKSVIGIQNFNIDRIRFYNEGLIGSISGQRFAETHLRSFWKEYVMNNSKPLGQYDNETNGRYSNQLLDSEKYEPQESKSTTYFDKNKHDEKQENTNVEPTIVKETTKDSESIPVNNQNLHPTHIINKDVERIPRYFYGALEEQEDNKIVTSKPKTYKEPLAFIIPIGDINKPRREKTDASKKLTASNSNNETHIEFLQKDLSNNFTNFDLTSSEITEPLLEAETPPKLFEDLNQFEHRIHDVDLDITYTINEILSLKYEDDLQNNSDENDENLNDSISDYSLTPEPMLQTIIELSESETPRPLRQLQSSNDNNIDLTAESNENNSLISDELLEDENENKSNGHTHTTGGIYEYSTNEFDNVAHLNDKTLHDSSNKKDEKIESKDNNDNIEVCSENILNEESKTIDYRNKNEPDFVSSVDLHLNDETLLDNKQILSIIPSSPNNDSLHEDLKEIAAKKIQRVYRQHLQNTANRFNKDSLKTDDTIKADDMELVSTTIDSLNTNFNKIDSPVEEIEIHNVNKENNIENSDKTFKEESCSKEEIKKFDEYSKNSISSDEQESNTVSLNDYSEVKNLNKSTENCNECSSSVTNNLNKDYNSNIENNNNQPLCKAEKYHEQHNFNNISPKGETSTFAGNLESELDISAIGHLSQNPIPSNNDSPSENFKEIAAKKIQRVYRQHLQKTANRDNKDNLKTYDKINSDDMELISTTVDSLNTNFNKVDSPVEEIETYNVNKENNIENSDKTFKDERNSKEQDKKFDEFSKNSNNSDERESEPVNSNSEMKNMINSIESSFECYSTVTNNLKMDCNSEKENNNNQPLHKAEKYHEQHNITEQSFKRENSSIIGNLQSELKVTANDRSNQKPSAPEAAIDNDMQVTDPAINTDKAAKIIQRFFKKNMKPKHKSNTNTDLQKTHWFVGDEPIVANKESPPLHKTKSEISFDETEAYVVLKTNLPQYLVDSNSLEDIDTKSFSRTPTAPITNQSSDSCSSSEHSLVEKCINLPKGSVLTDISQTPAVTAPYIGIQSRDAKGLEVNEKKSRYTNLIDQFITSERFYSDIVNRNYSYSDIKDIQFPASNITEITKILEEFLNSGSENLKSDIQYEILEEPCIKTTVKKEISSSGTSSSSDIDDAEDSLGTKTIKLQKPEIAIKKMQKRRNSTSKISNLENFKDYNFNEPSVMSIENLDTDEEGIVITRMQRDETRESTGQSDVDVVIGSTVKEDDSNLHENINFDSTFPSKGSLKRVYTIGDEVEAKFLLKNVTIDESIKYIEPPDYELKDSSLCLDDETTANIRHKMMAYSLSEADSDVFERTADNIDSSSWELRNKKYDDFNISTALIENGDTSTETESTTVSAITKIQAGTRGSFNSSKVSIGNAAISDSLEHLVKEAAAKRIQKMYRQHYRLKTANANNIIKSAPEYTKSMETTLAQKRSIMLQRGDALRNGSSPEEGTSSSNSGESENGKIISKTVDTSCFNSKTLSEQESKAIFIDNATSSCSLPSSAKSAAATRAEKIESNKRRWIAMRQNSMPVQIDSEVLRVIPKYIRKKIKSAEGEKKKDRRRILMD